ncbi:MAG: hypothetical protein M3453_18355 [Pseudomonadota bacterium]|nr:hypothetical protein [Pseudomonadota bacterium]
MISNTRTAQPDTSRAIAAERRNSMPSSSACAAPLRAGPRTASTFNDPGSRALSATRLALLSALLFSVSPNAVLAQDGMMSEAKALLERQVEGTGREAYTPETAVEFKESDNVFLKSALAIDFTFRKATVTLPLYRGLSPDGEEVYYIITDASDFEYAKQMGLNFAPKLRHAADSPGAQKVMVEDGVITFKGNVDFSPEYKVVPGSPMPFPPKEAKPGAMGDLEWSSAVVMPSGVVLNVQMVTNASGDHDRLIEKDLETQTVTLSLLDGVQGGEPYYYHLVTDVSADLPAVLEKGVYTPKLALLAEVGKSMPADKSALLGFSPVLNGPTEAMDMKEQGFAASLANGGIDPVNIFPIDPDNENSSEENNYSPMWDAHVNMWTEAAMQAGKVRRINSFEDLKSLIDEGLVESAMISPAGEGNEFVFGLRPTNAIINCPVIAQPVLTN